MSGRLEHVLSCCSIVLVCPLGLTNYQCSSLWSPRRPWRLICISHCAEYNFWGAGGPVAAHCPRPVYHGNQYHWLRTQIISGGNCSYLSCPCRQFAYILIDARLIVYVEIKNKEATIFTGRVGLKNRRTRYNLCVTMSTVSHCKLTSTLCTSDAKVKTTTVCLNLSCAAALVRIHEEIIITLNAAALSLATVDVYSGEI